MAFKAHLNIKTGIRTVTGITQTMACAMFPGCRLAQPNRIVGFGIPRDQGKDDKGNWKPTTDYRAAAIGPGTTDKTVTVYVTEHTFSATSGVELKAGELIGRRDDSIDIYTSPNQRLRKMMFKNIIDMVCGSLDKCMKAQFHTDVLPTSKRNTILGRVKASPEACLHFAEGGVSSGQMADDGENFASAIEKLAMVKRGEQEVRANLRCDEQTLTTLAALLAGYQTAVALCDAETEAE